MSSTTCEELVALLEEFFGSQNGSGATLPEIAQAESELAVVLPECYRSVIRIFGSLELDSWEIFGLGAGVPTYLNLVHMVKVEREASSGLLDSSLLPIMNNGGGDLFCLDLTTTDEDGDCRVRLWDHETRTIEAEAPELGVADGFCDWLGNETRRLLTERSLGR